MYKDLICYKDLYASNLLEGGLSKKSLFGEFDWKLSLDNCYHIPEIYTVRQLLDLNMY